ncbi:hypothetical protein N9O57_01625 [bacterium]|nr:hypothetical protein [bacterium]
MQLLPVIVGIFLILFAIYSIRKEDRSYPKLGIDYFLQGVTIKVPPWWTQVEKDSQKLNRLTFKRTDTRYEWHASFSYHFEDLASVEEKYKEIIKSKGILFDEVPSVIHRDQTAPKLIRHYKDTQAVRIESTATGPDSKRMYFDLTLIYFPSKGAYLLCENQSSVLNGMVEGPFYDKVLKNLDYS